MPDVVNVTILSVDTEVGAISVPRLLPGLSELSDAWILTVSFARSVAARFSNVESNAGQHVASGVGPRSESLGITLEKTSSD